VEIEFDARGANDAVFNRDVAAAIEAALGGPADGDPADRPDLHGDLPGLPAALGRGLATIHSSEVPPQVEPADLSSLIRMRLDHGAIATDELSDPYSRYDAGQLVTIWEDGAERCKDDSGLVCLIGAPRIDRLLMRDGEVAGVNRPFGLLGDRHLDLAVIQHGIHRTLGAEAVFGFYEAYGSDPNLVLLDHHVLSGLLLGWIG
jgi:hypothetical protein